MTHPGGRPSDLDRPLVLPDGTRTTVAAHIVTLRGLGYAIAQCASAVGLARETVARWQVIGNRSARRLAVYYEPDDERLDLDPDPDRILTEHERRCWEFCYAEQRAFAGFLQGLHASAVRVARGGIETRVTRETVVVERVQTGTGKRKRTEMREVRRDVTTTTSATLPSERMLTFLLERLAPASYGPNVRVQVETPSNEPLMPVETEPARIGSIADDAERFLAINAGPDGSPTDDR